jgi:polysaccharide export outer membrane protein
MRRPERSASLPLVLASAVVCVAPACGGAGSYVWVQDLPPPASPNAEYLVQVGDTVNVRVLGQDGMTTRTRVRADGRIALPMIGDVEVRGKKPSSLRAELEARFKDFLVAPSVTFNVEEFAPVHVSVLGEVGRPGVFPVAPQGGIAEALAAAGGCTDWADRDRIFVLRNEGKPLRIRFTWEAITRGDVAASRFVLRDGDVVVVE